MGGNYEEPVGTVTEYRGDVDAARIELGSGQLQVGDTIHIRGATSEVEEIVGAMQTATGPAEEAELGETVGIKVDQPVEEGATVFKVSDPYGQDEAQVIDQVFEAA